jgi:ABC-type dipeptide/oligopeptide/nickel transport system ATPase component
MASVLEVRNLSTHFFTSSGVIRALQRISFSLERGETLGLVGLSGSGKTVLADSLINVLRPPGRIVEGEILLEGEDLLQKSEGQMRNIRGKRIATVGSRPRAELYPLHTVGDQLARVYRAHNKVSSAEAASRAVEMLGRVGISDPVIRAKSYPHELSGGMTKRVMIGMALICTPEILIADEPGAGLDVTIQAQVLELVADLIARTAMSTLLITRDLGVIAHYCDRVGVLENGQLIEVKDVDEFFEGPEHPGSQHLLQVW